MIILILKLSGESNRKVRNCHRIYFKANLNEPKSGSKFLDGISYERLIFILIISIVFSIVILIITYLTRTKSTPFTVPSEATSKPIILPSLFLLKVYKVLLPEPNSSFLPDFKIKLSLFL